MGLLTRDQFADTKPGRAGKTYGSYVAFVNKNAPLRRQQRAARLGVGVPTLNELDYLGGMLGGVPQGFKPMADKQLVGQAGTDVHAIVDPALAQIRDSFGAHEKSGLDSIYGYGKTSAAELAPIAGRIKANYQGDEADMQGADQALRAFLGTQGATASADVAGKLGAAGLPQEAVDAAAAGAGGLQAGAAKSLAAGDYATLARSIGDRSADVSYAEKLPALSELQTGAAAGAFRGTTETAMNDQLGQLRSQIPGLTRQVLGDYRDREVTKANQLDQHRAALAQLAASFLGGSLDRGSQERIAQAGLSLDSSKLAQQNQQYYDGLATSLTRSEIAHGGNAKSNRQKAIRTRDDAKASVATSVSELATKLAHGQTVATEEPVLVKFPTKAGRYVKKGGGRTNDPALAETKPTKHVTAGLGYDELYKRAYALYAPQLRRYALKDAEIKAIIDQGLAGAGVTPPAPKPPPAPTPANTPAGWQTADLSTPYAGRH